MEDYLKYGRLQLVAHLFDSNSCFKTDGIISFQDLDLSNKTDSGYVFSIDFKSVLNNTPKSKTNVGSPNFLTDINFYLSSLFLPNANSILKPVLNFADEERRVFYVRFVATNPKDGSCNAVFKPSTAVKITYGEQNVEPVKVSSVEYHKIQRKTELETVDVWFEPARFQQEWFNTIGTMFILKTY